MKKVASILVAVALSTSVRAPVASAQGVFDPGVLTVTLGMDVLGQSEGKRAHGTRGKHSSAHKRPVLRGTTRFRPSMALRKRNLAQFITRLRSVNPQVAASLQSDFAKTDPIEARSSALRQTFGLHTNDVADMMTVDLVTAWYGIRGSTWTALRPQVRGVREQVRRALLSLPAFVSASDATKQQVAEEMLMQTVMFDAFVTASKGKPAQMAKIKGVINQNVQSAFHLDLSKLKLTNNGLRL